MAADDVVECTAGLSGGRGRPEGNTPSIVMGFLQLFSDAYPQGDFYLDGQNQRMDSTQAGISCVVGGTRQFRVNDTYQ